MSLQAWLAQRFSGTVDARALTVVRVGLATLVLLRTSDWTRAFFPMDHHAWVTGQEYHPAIEGVVEPAFHSGWLPAFPSGVVAALVLARTVLAVTLLVGFRSRTSAALLVLVGYALMAQDRFRFLHHLHLLWLLCGWMALAPSGHLGIDRGPRRVPRWSVQLLRWQLLVVYVSAGLAKLRFDWLSGQTLESLARHGLLEGWATRVPASALAPAVVVAELGIPLLLVAHRTRTVGVFAAFAFHASIEPAMMVSTFGALMMLWATLFFPWREEGLADSANR